MNQTAPICQSCSMPLMEEQHKGTEKDGTITDEYCIYCYKDGAFTSDMTLEQTIADSVNYAKDAGMTEEQMLAHAKAVLPTLKRWKKA